MNIENVTVEKTELHRLLSTGSGDAALLYLYISAGNDPEAAEVLVKFEGLNVSSKFGICGLPLRIDSYKTCSFGCRYCFANGRKIMEFEKTFDPFSDDE